MRHHIIEQSESWPVAILCKGMYFNKQAIIEAYVDPLVKRGVHRGDMIPFTLEYDEHGKASVKFIKDYLDKLLPTLQDCGVKYLYVADAAYFKVLTKQSKAEPNLGYVMPCAIKGYEYMQVVLGIGYQAMIYNPDSQTKLDQSLDALANHIHGTYVPPGTGIIHSSSYPNTTASIAAALRELHKYPELTADIEAFSLDFWDAGIGTISFAWDEHNGIAFACDYDAERLEEGHQVSEGFKKPNLAVRALLKEFIETYKGKLTWHHSGYDVTVCIYTLFMADLLDRVGMLRGLDIMCRGMDDTKIVAYLATNSTAGNVLGLKPLAQEFSGNWSKDDIKDIRKIPLKELLQYNLIDTLSTWYVKKKYWPIMVQDNQLDLYNTLFMPSMKVIIQMQLVGMPMHEQRIQEVKTELMGIRQLHLDTITKSPVIAMMNLIVQTNKMEAANAKLKTKQHALSKFADEVFNPGSPLQMQELLYTLMGLPILDYTDTKQPAVGADTIEKLIHHTQEPTYIDLLKALIAYGKVEKILSTFIPAFERAVKKDSTGIVWLHGSFNLGGTVSGRLSSSGPNLQNIPANSIYGKLIKTCFVAPPGWLFGGADFNSLEDMISALTTKDKNKLAVYIQGFDGHSLRASYYFRDQLMHIDQADAISVNSIAKSHPHLRQDSKAPTFALTYQGTWITLVNNLGWSEEKAKGVEKGYHDLYVESDEYIQRRLEQATHTGFVEVAFGLRVRTPMLSQVIWGSPKMPFAAAAEGRTAGNAMGQSYGQLNNRAAIAFMEKVWASPYRNEIFLVALIHDAAYIIMPDDTVIVEWVNKTLIKEMQWQDLPEIRHPIVKLGAELEIYWPSWKNAIVIPNNSSQEEIQDIAQKGKKKYYENLQKL